jgi:hypothetical protein
MYIYYVPSVILVAKLDASIFGPSRKHGFGDLDWYLHTNMYRTFAPACTYGGDARKPIQVQLCTHTQHAYKAIMHAGKKSFHSFNTITAQL